MKKAFKKFKDLFFEEEIYEEIIDEPEEDAVREEPIFQDLRLEGRPKKEETVRVEVKEEEKKSELLTLHPVKEKVAKPIEKPQVKKPETTKPVTGKMDYEFTQVISPIYGLKDQKQDQPVAKKPAVKKVSALKSPIGTVLSPMYGVYEENPLVKEVDVEPEISDLQVDDFIDHKEDASDTSKTNRVVNLSLFDDEQ